MNNEKKSNHYYRAKLNNLSKNPGTWIEFYFYEFNAYDKIIIDSLCMYTGIDDKNNKPVFENDIILTTPGTFDTFYHRIVVYRDANLPWEPLHYIKGFEIVGNIFDNPELDEKLFCYDKTRLHKLRNDIKLQGDDNE